MSILGWAIGALIGGAIVKSSYDDKKRRNTPLDYSNGVTEQVLEYIANDVASKKMFRRITSVSTNGANVYCTVESQSGISTWDFSISFNNYGKITGAYWLHNENVDSNLPDKFADEMSSEIHGFLDGDRSFMKQGRLTYSDAYYEGGILFGLAEGKGKLVFDDGRVFIGKFKNDDLDGKGEIHYPNGDRYYGEIENYEKEGKGRYVRADGKAFEGIFKDGKPNGIGKLMFTSGASIEGFFRGWASISGDAVIKYPDGKIYRGGCQKLLPNGQGRFEYTNGDIYIGSVKEGVLEGSGYLISADGCEYYGEFHNGSMNGKGRFRDADGVVLEGQFKDDQYIGPMT